MKDVEFHPVILRAKTAKIEAYDILCMEGGTDLGQEQDKLYEKRIFHSNRSIEMLFEVFFTNQSC